MGVDIKAYAVYGVKFNEADCKTYGIDMDNDDLYEYEHDVYEIIMDGMCGSYLVFGKVLAVVNEYNDDEYMELKTDNLSSHDLAVEFENIFGFDLPVSPMTFIFNHFS